MQLQTLKRKHIEIHNINDFLANGYLLRHGTVQGIDFTKLAVDWQAMDIEGSVFLGCSIPAADQATILSKGGLIFPEISGLPYRKYRSQLYTWQELYEPTSTQSTVDYDIYTHFSNSKYDPSLVESLCQRIHDHAVDDALRDFLRSDSEGNYAKTCIGVMGGHSTPRTDTYYSKTALICQQLAQEGFTIVSGGGPGTMEATNLGAYFANYDKESLLDAIDMMKSAPKYTDADFHNVSMEVIQKYPNGAENLAIPTWFYGHEPSNVFASHIAKYFSNSIREDTLLAICLHGILFSPGSAGTTQEIFMDAAQNHYATFGYYSPMIFLGTQRYTRDTTIYSTLQQLAKGTGYESLVHLTDEVDEAVALFKRLKPIPA